MTTNTPEIDYTTLESWELIKELRDDGSKWAKAFRQMAIKLGYSDMDEGWLIGWFANAIEVSSDVRRSSALAAKEAGETEQVVAFLRSHDWDSEMSAYAEAFAKMIEEGQHKRTKLAASPPPKPDAGDRETAERTVARWRAEAMAAHSSAAETEPVGDWVLVPREPTEEMKVAGCTARAHADYSQYRPPFERMYAATLAAAPAHPPPGFREGIEAAVRKVDALTPDVLGTPFGVEWRQGYLIAKQFSPLFPSPGSPPQEAWFAVDEVGNDNFATSIYENEDKGLLVARCNQNGKYPWQAASILRGLAANKAAHPPSGFREGIEAAVRKVDALTPDVLGTPFGVEWRQGYLIAKSEAIDALRSLSQPPSLEGKSE